MLAGLGTRPSDPSRRSRAGDSPAIPGTTSCCDQVATNVEAVSKRSVLRRPSIRRLGAAVVAVAFVAGATACGSDETTGATASSADDQLQVVTTVAPITSIAANIIGNRAEVVGIVPEGTNSHTFEPPPSAAEVMTTADVVFINGLQLEEPTKELAEANVADGVRIVQLGDETISPEQYKYDFSFPEDGGKPNPHLWTDPTLVKVYADIIRDNMVALDPEGTDYYNANFDEFVVLVDDFDAAIRESFDTVPEEQRKLVTYHDAYAYFADTYGWNVIGAIQPSDFGDPTPSEVVDLIDQIEAENVSAVFGSEVFPSPVLEQIANETGATYVDDLRDDDLPGAPGDEDHSWLGLMKFNFITMTEALGGDASALERFAVRNVTVDNAEYPQ
jgi:ABC-type Zn uptake system ZnuABC Zn-binding protein ZnuA